MIPVTRQPKPYRRPDRVPFGGGEWRPLRLVLDHDTLTEQDVTELLAFAEYQELELFHTAPDALPRLEIKEPTDDFVPIHMVGDGVGVFGVWNPGHLRERARQAATASDVVEETAYRELVLAAASDEIEADGFVTRSNFLQAEHGPEDPPVYTPTEAMALIGLALRLRGNTSIGADLADLSLDGTTFHFVLTRELIHGGWRWFSGCVASSHATGDDTAMNLGQTALERLMRVLQIRDRLHTQAKSPPSSTVGDELVFQFETFLLFLSASFDATARVAHLVYFDGNYHEAGWRRTGWLKQLRAAEPDLAALVADGTEGGTLLKLVGLLRNTIHGEALRAVAVQRAGVEPSNPIELHASNAKKILGYITTLGGLPANWGLESTHDRAHLTADRFTEALLPYAVRLLNDLMNGTAVERLPGVDLHNLMSPPPNTPSADPYGDMFSWEIRQRVRRLSGF